MDIPKGKPCSLPYSSNPLMAGNTMKIMAFVSVCPARRKESVFLLTQGLYRNAFQEKLFSFHVLGVLHV
jgi:hypothetical protein